MGRVWMCSSFCGSLDIKQKLGSLNGDLTHAYFLIGDFHPTKQLIHGCILFFPLSAFPAYMALATDWSNPLKSWAGQKSVTVQWQCCFPLIFRLDLWRGWLAFGPIATITASAKDVSWRKTTDWN